MRIEIDSESGFCFGVTTAIRKAEEELAKGNTLYCLGDIVHNGMECERLRQMGLVTIGHDDMERLHNVKVLLRAHGEPPATYELARRNNIEIIDATCPVVLKLQKRIKEQYTSHSTQIVIFGKKGHAEVNGLVGQTAGEALVIGSIEEIDAIDFSRPVALFSQTTKDPDEFRRLADCIRARRPDAEVYDTICRQVAQRHQSLVAFAGSHAVVLFVSGRESSNGKVLFDLCRSVNARTYWLENASQIDLDWFRDGDSVGICGATSTPKWQLEEIFLYLQDVTKS